LINLNKTTSAPFVTVRKRRVRDKNGELKDVRKFFTFKYDSSYASSKKNNSIDLFKEGKNTGITIEESTLLFPDNFILLAENQVGAYNGSELDIFYNLKLLAMEQQLDNLLSVLVVKLTEIEDFLREKKVIPTTGKTSTKMVYKSLLKAFEDERDLIAFWKADTIKYDRELLSENTNVREKKKIIDMIDTLLQQQEEKEQTMSNDSKLKIQDVQNHYQKNSKALAYKKVQILKDTEQQQQLLEDRKEKENKEKEEAKKKKTNIKKFEVLKLPTKTSEIREEKSDTISANVLSKMIKLMI
jgi:hypothetical protein